MVYIDYKNGVFPFNYSSFGHCYSYFPFLFQVSLKKKRHYAFTSKMESSIKLVSVATAIVGFATPFVFATENCRYWLFARC